MCEFAASSALQFRSITPRGKRHKLLAVSSGGGHWVQLMRIKHAFEGCEVSWTSPFTNCIALK